MFKRNMVLGYICLVGIPLLALVGILDAGHDLIAPVPLGGMWDLQADLTPLAASTCAASLATSRQPVLAISQSGLYLDLTLDGLHGSGRVENAVVRGSFALAAKQAGCGGGKEALVWSASLDRSAGNGLLAGSIGVNGCSACPAIPFRATRRAVSRRPNP